MGVPFFVSNLSPYSCPPVFPLLFLAGRRMTAYILLPPEGVVNRTGDASSENSRVFNHDVQPRRGPLTALRRVSGYAADWARLSLHVRTHPAVCWAGARL